MQFGFPGGGFPFPGQPMGNPFNRGPNFPGQNFQFPPNFEQGNSHRENMYNPFGGNNPQQQYPQKYAPQYPQNIEAQEENEPEYEMYKNAYGTFPVTKSVDGNENLGSNFHSASVARSFRSHDREFGSFVSPPVSEMGVRNNPYGNTDPNFNGFPRQRSHGFFPNAGFGPFMR